MSHNSQQRNHEDRLDPILIMAAAGQGEAREAFVRKLDYAMTPKGQAVIDGYDEMDNPNSRCASATEVTCTAAPWIAIYRDDLDLP